MAAVARGGRAVIAGQALLLSLLYVFLYFRSVYIGYLSLWRTASGPSRRSWTAKWYQRLQIMSDFHAGLAQQLPDRPRHRRAVGAARDRGRDRHSPLPGAPPRLAASAVTRAPVRRPGADRHLDLDVQPQRPGPARATSPRRSLANATYGLAFAFLVILAQLVRYDWRLDEAAMVFGARPARCFFEVTLPNIWPSVLGAFLVSFILGVQQSGDLLLQSRRHPDPADGRLGLAPPRHRARALRARDARQPRRLRAPVHPLPPAPHRPAAPRRPGGVRSTSTPAPRSRGTPGRR